MLFHALRHVSAHFQACFEVLGGLSCSEYPATVAEVLCEDCSDLYCWEAFIELHRRGNRLRHVPLRLDAEGQLYRGALESRSSWVLVGKVDMAWIKQFRCLFGARN